MENASKALIIAGAILLSILLIGLGMFVYQNASGAMDGVNMDAEKIDAYNSKFVQYEGTKSGTQVKALYNLVKSHNNANIDDPSLQINVVNREAQDGNSPDTNVTEFNPPKDQIKSGKTYTITLGYDQKSGYIIEIGVVEKK